VDDKQHNESGEESQNNNKDAILVFFSTLGQWLMQNCYEMHIDGTFATTPDPFKQLVFIQAKQKGNRAVPVAFALLTRKVMKYDVSHLNFQIFKNFFL
jgi:hypothetical protein